MVAVLSCQMVLAADGATNDKAAVEAVISGLYAKKISSVEYPLGKQRMIQVCDYLRTVFEDSLLGKRTFGCVGPDRFPNIPNEELSLLDDGNVLPKASIAQTRMDGSEAVVKVKTPIGKGLTPTRIVYFMRKSDAGWRVFNVLSYDEWPLDTNREGGCKDPSGHYRFAQPPRSEADLEDLPPLCRKLESDNFKRNGWGK
jgi:hypothetical protein